MPICQKCGGELKPSKYEGGKPYCPVCYKKYKQAKENASTVSSTNPKQNYHYQIQGDFKTSLEYKELVKELNDIKWAVHALVATLIKGTDKEQAYELHRIPLIEKSKPVIEGEFNPDDLPF